VVLVGGWLAGAVTARAEAAREEAFQRDLAYRLQQPMAQGMDVSAALEAWFAARRTPAGEGEAPRLQLYRQGMAALRQVKPLPPATWPPAPTGVTLELLEEVVIPELGDLLGPPLPKPPAGVECRAVRFTVGGVKQYGVILRPKAAGKYPLLLFLHGAAFGVPSYQLPWLAELAARGYVVAAPALRGEDLFAMPSLLKFEPEYKSDGKIENLVGEVDDALGMVDGAFKLEYVAPGKFALIGHSFGAGVGLLVAARAPNLACAISYDAWLVNPFRFYWDRLRDGPNNWLSWEEYCEQPVAAQLQGLMQRSIVHHADRLKAPVLLFMGGAYNGSVFHQSHDDLVARLQAAKKEFTYEIIPGGGHNFLLYPTEEPAQLAFKLQDEWLKRYLPPVAPPPLPAPAAP
jgi:dienelactone hydrolase